MRNMSFFLTTGAVRKRTKTETRRFGWAFLKPGDRVQACVKCQGLKPGEKLEKIAVLEITGNFSEPLGAITESEVEAEGFPGMTPGHFVSMFMHHMPKVPKTGEKTTPSTLVNRITFDYVED